MTILGLEENFEFGANFGLGENLGVGPKFWVLVKFLGLRGKNY